MSRARDLADGTFSGEFAADSPTLVVDATNNRVGVGTASPSSKLYVQSDNNVLTNLSAASSYHLNLQNPQNDNGEAVGVSFGLSAGGDIGASIYHERKGSNSYGDLVIGTKPFGGSVTERMRIDSAGRVTMPYQVGFKASGLVSSPTPPSLLVYNDLSVYGGFNRGGHYSNTTGRFTAPIAGVYLFSASAMGNSDAGRLMIRLVLNSTDAHQGSSSSNSSEYQDSKFTVAVYLNANDYVEVKLEGPKGLHGTNPLEYYFTGLLIG